MFFKKIFKKKKEKIVSDSNNDKFIEGYHYYMSGVSAYKENMLSEALLFFDKSIQLGYEYDDIYSYRAYCLQNLKYYYDSIDDFNISIKLNSLSANHYFGRGFSRGFIGDIDGEIEDLETAVNLVRSNPNKYIEYDKFAQELGWENCLSLYTYHLENAINTKKKLENIPLYKDIYFKDIDQLKKRRNLD